MNKADIVRAWKDPLYRATLSPEQLATLPNHPAGVVEISDDQIRAAGGTLITTAMTCTEPSFNGWKSCCPTTW
jgi:mersacidin/lichenicidin family type 2 lantibiotic